MAIQNSLIPKKSALKIVSHRAVEAAALTELRRADPDAAAVTQFVDLVEEIHDIEPDLEAAEDPRNFHNALQRQVHCPIIRNALGVGETASKSASVKKIARDFPVVPGVGSADSGGPSLIVIEKDPMFVDERILGGVEKKLGRAPMDAAGPFPGDVAIGGPGTVIVVGGEFAAVNPAALVIERRLNECLPELAFVQSGMRAFVKSVEADVPAFHDFLGDAGVEIMGPLGTNGRIFGDGRSIGGPGEFGDSALRNRFQRRRREVTRVTDMERG